MKKRSAAAFLLAGFAVGVIAGVVLSKCLKKDDDYIFITAIPIDDITDKFYNGEEYYITVLFEDYLVEEYRLTSDTFTFPTTKSLYDRAELNVGHVGVSLQVTLPVTLPEGSKPPDMGLILRENLTEYCIITGATVEGNIPID